METEHLIHNIYLLRITWIKLLLLWLLEWSPNNNLIKMEIWSLKVQRMWMWHRKGSNNVHGFCIYVVLKSVTSQIIDPYVLYIVNNHNIIVECIDRQSLKMSTQKRHGRHNNIIEIIAVPVHRNRHNLFYQKTVSQLASR